MSYLLISYHIQEIGSEGLAKLSAEDDSTGSEKLVRLKEQLQLEEVFRLSTCNRVEYLFYSRDIGQLIDRINHRHSLPIDAAKFYSSDESVVQHLLEVALSMDSMVFGESQILGQLKRAFQEALKSEPIGPKISALLQEVLKHAKRIRTETRLRSIHTSVATVAARHFLMQQEPSSDPVLLVGAGETNQLVARYLTKHGRRPLLWANRSLDRALACQKEFGGELLTWSDFLAAKLPPLSACFLATSAGEPIFLPAHWQSSQCPWVFDLSIPPNATAEEMRSCGAHYIGMDELGESLAREQENYQLLKQQLRDKIRQAGQEILRLLEEKKLDPLIAESVENIDFLLSSAFQNLPKELADLSSAQRQALKQWSRALMQKTKHEHIQQLKRLRKKDSE